MRLTLAPAKSFPDIDNLYNSTSHGVASVTTPREIHWEAVDKGSEGVRHVLIRRPRNQQRLQRKAP